MVSHAILDGKRPVPTEYPARRMHWRVRIALFGLFIASAYDARAGEDPRPLSGAANISQPPAPPIAASQPLLPPPPGAHGSAIADPPEPANRAIPTSPWWHQAIGQSLGLAPQTRTITADEAAVESLARSPDIAAIRVQPLIRSADISRQQSAFDWNNFLESTWADRSDPIGSTLQTGSTSGRYNDRLLNGAAGVRKLNPLGSEIELAERMGWQKNNSLFLVPNPQSTSRLELKITQPLLAGRGRSYNMRRIIEADLSAQAASADSIRRLQDYLLEVTTAYWELYRSRAVYLQRRRAVDRALELAQSIEQRHTLDATTRQILRVKTAAAERQSELMAAAGRADTAVIRLRRRIGMMGPADHETELLPLQPPPVDPLQLDREAAVQAAFTNRPSIAAAIDQVRIASVRLGARRNELLPQLNLIAGAYVAGLTANRTFGNAFGRQFLEGRPSYNVGLSWERPVGNRAAKAAFRQQQWELRAAVSNYESAIQDVQQEIDLAIVQADIAYQTLKQRWQTLRIARDENAYLQDRWETSPGADSSPIVLLDDLIESYTRVANEEVAVATAEAGHAVAILRLNRALGTLLNASQLPQPTAAPPMALPAEHASVAAPLGEPLPRAPEPVAPPASHPAGGKP